MVVILLSASAFTQAPEILSYQAVIRNIENELITNQVISMRIQIIQGSESGTPVYTETQTTSTNANGLISIGIGGDL